MSKMKTPALAVVVVFAIFVAAASSATALEFKAAVYPVKVSAVGIENQVYKMGAAEIKCETSSFGPTAAIANAVKAILISAAYSKCSAFGSTKATINMKSCGFLFLVGATLNKNKVHIKCGTAGDKIVVKAESTSCEVGVPAQTELTEVTYENKAGKVKIIPNISKIKYEIIKTGVGCPANNMESATYNGAAEASGVSLNELEEFVEHDNIEVS